MAVLVEGEHALVANKLHRLLRVGERVLDANAVVLLHPVKEAVCLGVEAARVEREDAELAAREVSILDEGDVLGAGEGDCDLVAEALRRVGAMCASSTYAAVTANFHSDMRQSIVLSLFVLKIAQSRSNPGVLV